MNIRRSDDEDEDEEGGETPNGNIAEDPPGQSFPGQPTGDVREPDTPGTVEGADEDRKNQLDIAIALIDMRTFQPFM